jgi:hypothetical protein
MAGKIVLTALRHVWGTLEPTNCPRALMGGLSLALWKHVRNTRDVDLLIGLEHTSVEAVLDVLMLSSGRIIDRADAAALLRLNRTNLDLSYLLTWVNQLTLAAEWADVWQEAFPGEQLPETS